jgi:integrase
MPRKSRPNLTVASINRLRASDEGKRVEVGDGRVAGLELRVTPRGVKTFTYLYRSAVDGRQRRVTLGHWPELDSAQAKALEEARKEALRLAAEVAAGRDPVEDERRRAAAARAADQRSLRWLAGEYIAVEAKPSIKTWKAAEAKLGKHWLSTLGDVPFEEVTRVQLYSVIDRLVREGRYGAASEARKHITRLYSWALDRGHVQTSPAIRLRHRALDGRPEAGRELSSDELAAVWHGATALGTPWTQALRVLLLTGARRSEVCEARWSEVTADRWLEVPAARFKTRRAFAIPLSSAAWAQLESLPRYALRNAYIFSVRVGRSPIRGWVRKKRELDAAAAELLGHELPRYRLHDLRVTCRTRLAMLGVHFTTAEAVIGHTRAGIHAVYDKYDLRAERREALERYAAHVMEVVGGQRGRQTA